MNFQYDPKISLGTIVETLALLGTVGAMYVSLTNADVRHDEQIKTLGSEVVRIDTAQKQLQADVKTDLKEIKDTVTAIRLQQAASAKR